MPLVGLVSLTLVRVPHVDFSFRYEEFLWTLSGIFSPTFTFVNLVMWVTAFDSFKCYVSNGEPSHFA